MIDTHCHLTNPQLADDMQQVVSRAQQAGVDRMITVAVTPDDAYAAVRAAEQFDGVYATVGVHPHYAAQCPDRESIIQTMHALAIHPCVVAFGEMGLDRHYDDPPIEDQKRVFNWQLEAAAQDTQLPIIIHNREATDETVGMIRDSGLPGERFVFHCFTGTEKELDTILDLGAWVSFTGIVTFSNAKEIAACAKRMPLDRMMIETDSPYLAPEPFRKVRPNVPQYVPHVAAFIARLRQLDESAFTEKMDANADRFFRL